MLKLSKVPADKNLKTMSPLSDQGSDVGSSFSSLARAVLDRTRPRGAHARAAAYLQELDSHSDVEASDSDDTVNGAAECAGQAPTHSVGGCEPHGEEAGRGGPPRASVAALGLIGCTLFALAAGATATLAPQSPP